jgi:UDP-N-acetylmuramoyl-L-alanyl-D-glutamate--2,6-diaminopimelate ligase
MFQILKNYYHLAIAVVSNLWFGFPSKGIKVIGVTGTDGKTTTVNLIYHILKSSGFNASMISSVGAIINGKNYGIGFHVTNPSSFSLQKFIKMIKKTGENDVLVLEVTSHALDQFRNWGIHFDVGVITNITREHLDYHKTYENYVKTKAKLLKMSDVSVINADDESFNMLSKMNFKKTIVYGIEKKADMNLKKLNIKFNLPGKFNEYNFLAAATASSLLGISREQIQKAMKNFKLPTGRMQEIYSNDFRYIIYFAHTPNKFFQLLKSLRPEVKGRIIHIFGSAGKRDETKRPEMGRISSQYSDVIILTAEDPRNEKIEKISSDIAKGIKNFKQEDYKNYNQKQKKGIYFLINDRKEAIDFAVSIAQKGDLVISTGKGHEESMNYGKGEVSWSELEVACEAIKRHEKK